MTFALDHVPSKYVQIEQSTDTFTAFFSRAVPRKSRYFVHSVSTRILEVRYSCYYVLLMLAMLNTCQLAAKHWLSSEKAKSENENGEAIAVGAR